MFGRHVIHVDQIREDASCEGQVIIACRGCGFVVGVTSPGLHTSGCLIFPGRDLHALYCIRCRPDLVPPDNELRVVIEEFLIQGIAELN